MDIIGKLIDHQQAIRGDIWISKSPDLIHWGGYQILMEPEQGTWEAIKLEDQVHQ